MSLLEVIRQLDEDRRETLRRVALVLLAEQRSKRSSDAALEREVLRRIG